MNKKKTKRVSADDDYPYKCRCGADGFVDVGEGKPNRYPCLECYKKMRSKRQKVKK